MRSVSLGHDRVDGLQRAVGKFQVFGQHDNRNFGPDLLDQIRNRGAVQQTEMVLQDNAIYRSRHKKPQTLGPTGRGQKFVSVILQQTQFGRIAVDAE
jgi:hypothetical protein